MSSISAAFITALSYVPKDGAVQLPDIDKETGIGISVAIAGNILISLALNLQKLAHRRRDLENNPRTEGVKPDNRPIVRTPQARMERVREASGENHDMDRPDGALLSDEHALLQSPVGLRLPGTQPPLPRTTDYGSSPHSHATPIKKKRKPLLSLFSLRSRSSAKPNTHALPARNTSENTHLLSPGVVNSPAPNPGETRNPSPVANIVENRNESDYLKSKLWWAGFMLMNVGELGNFISYAFAPASVVAPLGTVALIANCFFAPLLLKERFRRVEIFGILIAIIGAITVVLSANTSETRLDHDGLIHAISQRPFIIYSIMYVVGAIILSGLSAGPRGRDWILVDVGLCALFGGFTVLATKALSTLLTMEWIRIFTEWITYPVVVVLAGTGIGQIRYLNRALMRFDSKIVVPAQFVLFNLSAIIGSAILYGDFNKTTFHQMLTFLYGCTATFCGVFMIAWSGPADAPPDQESVWTDLEATTPSTPGDLPHLGLGSLGQRNRLVDDGRSTSIRRKHSSGGLVGFSPAQRLLIAHTSPRDEFEHLDSWDDQGSVATPDSSTGRRRTISWLEDDLMDRHHKKIPTGAEISTERQVRAGGELSRMSSFMNPL